jgi:hypothetical protein
MENNGTLEILFNKSKIIKHLLIAAAFVACGLWFLISPPQISNPIFGNPVVLTVVGLLVTIFFGGMGLFLLGKMWAKSPAIVLNDLGMDDRSSLFAAGFVPWAEISSTYILELKGQRMIMFQLGNPEAYLAKLGLVKRFFLHFNYRFYKAHLALSPNILDIPLEELHQKINSYMEPVTEL